MKNIFIKLAIILVASLFLGCDGNNSDNVLIDDEKYILFGEMDESMQDVFTEELGMSSDLLSGISEDDLDVCNETYRLYEDKSALCKGDNNEGSWVFNTTNWMSKLPDSKRLNEIIMPGSHDAGMSQCDYPASIFFLTKKEERAAQENITVTQKYNIFFQLSSGARYFDIRLQWRNNDLRTYHRESVLGIDFGCNGETFTQIMLSTIYFLDQNPTETVILKLSFKREDALALNQTKFFLETFVAVHKDRTYVTTTPQENLAKVPLEDLRGKIVFIIDDAPSMIDSTQGRHFYRDAAVYEEPVPSIKICYNALYIPHYNGATLSVFDVYSNSEDTARVIDDQTNYLYKTAGLRQPYLFLYSWTRTPSITITNAFEKVPKAANNEFSIEKLANEWPFGVNLYLPNMLHALYKDGFNMPNIVYYDYIDVYYNSHIIQYNFRTRYMGAISDRYKITIDEKKDNYLYSLNQNLVMWSLNFKRRYGTLRFKRFNSQDNQFFKIDKIDWVSTDPFDWEFDQQWSSTSQTYPAYWWHNYEYVYDFKLQNTRWTTSSGSSVNIIEKLPKEIQ